MTAEDEVVRRGGWERIFPCEGMAKMEYVLHGLWGVEVGGRGAQRGRTERRPDGRTEGQKEDVQRHCCQDRSRYINCLLGEARGGHALVEDCGALIEVMPVGGT